MRVKGMEGRKKKRRGKREILNKTGGEWAQKIIQPMRLKKPVEIQFLGLIERE